MNFLKRKIRKLIYGEDATSEDLLNYLSSRGATVGKGVKNRAFIEQMNTSDNYDATAAILSRIKPKFKSYSDFFDYCFSRGGDEG